jgi:hypothetical protein
MISPSVGCWTGFRLSSVPAKSLETVNRTRRKTKLRSRYSNSQVSASDTRHSEGTNKDTGDLEKELQCFKRIHFRFQNTPQSSLIHRVVVPQGFWFCCIPACLQPNNETLAPVYCSSCGHRRDARCLDGRCPKAWVRVTWPRKYRRQVTL